MQKDPIVEEVRTIREAYAAQLGYDLDAIYRDLKEQERESDQELVSFLPKRLEKAEQA